MTMKNQLGNDSRFEKLCDLLLESKSKVYKEHPNTIHLIRPLHEREYTILIKRYLEGLPRKQISEDLFGSWEHGLQRLKVLEERALFKIAIHLFLNKKGD